MILFMIGYMGSGKSTIGRWLADKLNSDFIDTDKIIEEREGDSISNIFATRGEEYFRKAERDLLIELANDNTSEIRDIIIATGGGMPCFFDNMELMNRSGCTIYLKCSAQLLAHHLKSAQNRRPLIRDLQPEEMVAFIERMLQGREPHYRLSQLVVDCDNNTNEQILLLVKEHIKQLKNEE